MAKIKAANRTFDVTPDQNTVDTVTTAIPAQGSSTDIRTFRPARARTEPLLDTRDIGPSGTSGGVSSREGYTPSRKDCGDVELGTYDAVRPNPDLKR